MTRPNTDMLKILSGEFNIPINTLPGSPPAAGLPVLRLVSTYEKDGANPELAVCKKR